MEIFDSMDVDHDGTISETEFISMLGGGRERSPMAINSNLSKNLGYVASRLTHKYGSLPKAFTYFDLNRDNEINKNEFLQGLNALSIGMPLTD